APAVCRGGADRSGSGLSGRGRGGGPPRRAAAPPAPGGPGRARPSVRGPRGVRPPPPAADGFAPRAPARAARPPPPRRRAAPAPTVRGAPVPRRPPDPPTLIVRTARPYEAKEALRSFSPSATEVTFRKRTFYLFRPPPAKAPLERARPEAVHLLDERTILRG